MTSENKISIVIAFGLLIFVSMLVADHFSIASNKEVAKLGDNIPTPPMITPEPLDDGSTLFVINNVKPQKNGDEIHTIAKGETLRSICSQYYGDSGLANALAQWNNLPNANTLSPGQSISLPIQSSLITAGFSSSVNIVENTKPDAQVTTGTGNYIVKSGDTLSELAYKLLGTSKKTTELFNYNRDIMPNPDTISPGMVLQYPLQ